MLCHSLTKRLGIILITTAVLSTGAFAQGQAPTAEQRNAQTDALIQRTYNAHHREAMPSNHPTEFRTTFTELQKYALWLENLKTALRYQSPDRTTTGDLAGRGVVAVGGVGLSADAGVGLSASPTHFRPMARTGMGFGEGLFGLMAGFKATRSREFTLEYLPFDIRAHRVSPDTEWLEKTKKSDWMMYVDPSITDAALLGGTHASDYGSDGTEGGGGFHFGLGSFNEKARVDLRATVPFFIPRWTAVRMKTLEANLDRAILELNQGNVDGAQRLMSQLNETYSLLIHQDNIKDLNLSQIDRLPASHPLASIENVLARRPVAPLPILRACFALVTSTVTGKI